MAADPHTPPAARSLRGRGRLLLPRAIALLPLVLAGASGGGCSDDASAVTTVFRPETTEVVIEVDYQPGAEPYVAFANRDGTPWRLFRVNADALFEAAPKTLEVPEALSEMQRLDDVTATTFSAEDLRAIADAHRDRVDGGSSRAYYVVFLNGLYRDEDGVQPQVLGVNLTGTPIIAMFKPVYSGALSAAFVEQTVLVHEFGHAVGLVNVGLEMVEDHEDREHPGHTTDRDCVMYWANEGLADLADFVRDYLATGDEVLWGEHALADARAAATR